MKFKKPALMAMPILDLEALNAKQLDTLASSFDILAEKKLLPFSCMAEDPARAAIDQAISSALGLPDVTPIREMLGREPVVTNRALLPEEPVAEAESPQMDLFS